MDFPSLRIFLSVAEHRSVTRAARALGRVASNVTTRIQQLEEDLGVELFNRDGKQMTLTRDGRIFLSYAKRMASLADEARHALSPPRGDEILRVGTMESTAACRMPDAIARFTAAAPAVSLRLTMGATRDLARAVIDEEIDCALVAVPQKLSAKEWLPDLDLSDIGTISVWIEDLLIVLPKVHRPIRSAADINASKLVALEAGCTYRRMAEDWIGSAASIKVIEVSSYHALIATVLAGEAIGVLPASMLPQLHLAEGMMQCFQFGSSETILVARANNSPPALDEFRASLFGSDATH